MTTAAEGPHRRRYTIAHLLLLAPWVALVAGAWKAITDNSFLWHVRAGTAQVGQAEVLTADPFSFTMPGESWLTQSWLAEILYGWLEEATGLAFVPFMLVVVGGLTFVAIGLISYERARSVAATALLLLVSVVALISFLVPRPVVFSYLLMSLVILAWSRPRTRWSLPFLFWLWAAVHGSFVIGLVYVGIMVLLDREWRALPTAIMCGLATLVTAHGLGVVRFLLDFGASRAALDALTEWRRPGLGDVAFVAFLALILVIVIGFYRRRIGLSRLLLVIPFLALGVSSVRAIPPAFLALLPLAATSLAGLRIPFQTALTPRLAGIAGLAVLALPFFLRSDARLPEDRFPIAALAHLTDARTYHDDVTGGFVIWAEWPERQVYVDDRAELYGARLSELVSVRTGETDWRPVFERDGIEQALLITGEPLAVSLEEEGGWSPRYQDENFVILAP